MQVIKLFNSKKNPAPAPAPAELEAVEFSADSAPALPELREVETNQDIEAARTETLVYQARNGDLTAFNELVTCYEQRVYNLSCRLLGDKDAAADATQDTFWQAYKALNQYRGGSFKSWLLRIASNQCYDQMRAKARRPAASLDALLEEAEETGGSILGQMEDSGADPQDHVMRREMLREVSEALQQLPYEQRLVVVLSDVQGLSYEEISEVTNASLGTVKSRLNRGRLKLRESLQKNRELFDGKFRL